MILSANDVMSLPEFIGQDPDIIQEKLDAIEELIRSYTHNNFQNRMMRIEASSLDGEFYGTSPFFSVGDTLEVSQSGVNDGLYVITEVNPHTIRVNRPLYDVEYNLVTKVVYPAAIRKGVLDMMKWEISMRDKVGVQSETLSRHSVTYYNMDGDNSEMGYPKSLLGFLKPYMKARF